MNPPSLQGSSPENRVLSRQGIAALTAVIMAQGVTSTTHANNAAKEWDAAEARGEKATELPQVDVSADLDKKVASPKFTEPLRDTPQTVIAIPSEVYLQQGAMTLSDVLRNTSGITFAAGEGGGATSTAGDSFYLRGFDTTNSIFIDGVRDVGAYSRDVFNIEQVQIAKGPAGADIGRGGASGYINLSTKIPHAENFAGSSLIYGFDETTSGSRRRTTVDVNRSLPDATVKGLAVRVNAFWQDNDVVGRDYAENKTWGIAPSLAWGLGTPTRAFVTYQHVKQDNLPDYGLPSALLPGYVSPVPVPQVDRSTFYGLTADFDEVNADAGMLRLEHDVNQDVKFSNQTRYSANQRTAVATTPGSNSAAYVPATDLLTRSRQATKRDSSILSNQTNVSGALEIGEVLNRFTGGLELTRERSDSPAWITAALTPILLERSDPPAAPSGTPTRSGAYTNAKTETGAWYLFDTAHFGDHWQANASLRGERYTTDYLSVATTGIPSPVDASHNLFSWKGGLVYKPVKAGSIYVAYAVTNTPPGTDFTLSSAVGNQNNPDTDPQETKNFEVGVKWDFCRGRLSTTAAIFRTVNDKTVFTDPILGAIPTGKQTVKGAELGATGKISDNWLVLASVAYLDSEINSGTTAGGNPAGAELPLIPKYSGNFFTSYRLPFKLVIGGGGNYSDAVSRRDNNSPAVPRQMPSYWIFNALASYPVTKNVSLRFNVNNLFDREYTQSFNNNGARFGPGAPRAYLLSADLKW